MKKQFNNELGFTLIETVIAGSLMIIMVFTISTTMLYQHGQNRLLQQKIEALELEQDLSRYLIDANNCDCMFVSGQGSPINLAAGTTVSNISLNQGCSGTPWVAPESEVQGSRTGLFVGSVNLENISSTAAGSYSANLVINLESGNNGVALKPLSMQQTFHTTTTGDISSCSGLRQMTEYKIDQFCATIPNAQIDPATGKCTVTGAPVVPVLGTNPPGSTCGASGTGLVINSGGTPECLHVSNGVLTTSPL